MNLRRWDRSCDAGGPWAPAIPARLTEASLTGWELNLNHSSLRVSAFPCCGAGKIQMGDGDSIPVLRAGRSPRVGRFTLYVSAAGRKFPRLRFAVSSLFAKHNCGVVPGHPRARSRLAAG